MYIDKIIIIIQLFTGLAETLSGEGPFTVFAPTNEAFAKIPKGTLDGLLADKEALTAVLLRHVIPGTIYYKGICWKTHTTAGGEEIATQVRFNHLCSTIGPCNFKIYFLAERL